MLELSSLALVETLDTTAGHRAPGELEFPGELLLAVQDIIALLTWSSLLTDL